MTDAVLPVLVAGAERIHQAPLAGDAARGRCKCTARQRPSVMQGNHADRRECGKRRRREVLVTAVAGEYPARFGVPWRILHSQNNAGVVAVFARPLPNLELAAMLQRKRADRIGGVNKELPTRADDVVRKRQLYGPDVLQRRDPCSL